MLIHQEKLILTTSSGDVSDNTDHIMGICHNMLVKPATAITQYDFSITNADGIIIHKRTSEIGTYSESLPLALRGIYTISIENATNDENFLIQLNIEE